MKEEEKCEEEKEKMGRMRNNLSVWTISMI
jgi:hypothetical protein